MLRAFREWLRRPVVIRLEAELVPPGSTVLLHVRRPFQLQQEHREALLAACRGAFAGKQVTFLIVEPSIVAHLCRCDHCGNGRDGRENRCPELDRSLAVQAGDPVGESPERRNPGAA